MKYKRVLIKLSGSFFSAADGHGLDIGATERVAEEIALLHEKGIEIATVNGAGNIFRGRSRLRGFDRVAADKIGILATLPNAFALTEALNEKGIETRLMCAFEVPGIARHFDVFRARKLLAEKKILVLAGGTGNSYFTTDTAAVLRASELNADILLKATDVDGIYDADPHTAKTSQKYVTLTYEEALARSLQIMDQTAFAMARENNLPILVFKFAAGILGEVLENPSIGTLISS